MVDKGMARVTGGWLEKYMTVGKLREILETLPAEYEIEPNQVGNLSVYAGPGKFIGYVDFASEEFMK